MTDAEPPVRRVPKYLEIRADLLRRIQAREFTVGQALPAQAALSRDYGVTLMTLRQALRSLEDDGVIAQQPGRGTFVTPAPPVLNLRSLNGLAQDMAEQGVELSTEVVRRDRRVLPRVVAAALSRERDERGLRLERVRRIGRRPVVHQVSWIPSPWAEPLDDVDFAAASLYASLRERCALVIDAADEVIASRAVPRATARATATAAGRPAMVSERTTYDSTGVPIVYDHAVILDDALRILARRTRTDVTVTWATGR